MIKTDYINVWKFQRIDKLWKQNQINAIGWLIWKLMSDIYFGGSSISSNLIRLRYICVIRQTENIST